MITVFTPTFNRSHTLTRLYESLQRQTLTDFEWIIVDDGSVDDTSSLCKSFSEDAPFDITYHWQDGLGKHAAINMAATLAKGEWFFIVDSDDYLPDDSLEMNTKYLKQVENDPRFAGVSGLAAYPSGGVVVGRGVTLADLNERVRRKFNSEFIDATPQRYRSHFKMPGDRAEIVRTSVLKQHPFPIFHGERFLSEFYLWQSISNDGLLFRWFNRITYHCEYLPEGLSANMKDVMLANPRGRTFEEMFAMGCPLPLTRRLLASVNFWRYGRLAGYSNQELWAFAPNQALGLVGALVSMVLPLRGKLT